MMKRILLSIVLLTLGALFASSGHHHWSEDPVRSYLPSKGIVLDHEVKVNRQRWVEDVPKAMELTTRIEFPPDAGRERTTAVVREFFTHGDSAWKLASTEPVGSQVACLIAPGTQEGIRDSWEPSGPMLAMVVGGVLMLMAVGMHLPFRPVGWGGHALVIAVLLAFFIGGVVTASQMWPTVIQHVRATGWDLLSCQVISHRSYRSGKSNTHELLVRYTAAGQQRETVLNGAFFGLGVENKDARQCRVNPSKPWQVTLSWGWRPGLGVALFPVPFLMIGLLGLFIPFSALLQRQIKSKQTWKLLRMEPWQDAISQGFVLLFIGSIVGVFVSLCAEMWLQGEGGSWFFTLLLIPFVGWTLKQGVSFATSVVKAMKRRNVR